MDSTSSVAPHAQAEFDAAITTVRSVPAPESGDPARDVADAVARMRALHAQADSDPALRQKILDKESADEKKAGYDAGYLWAKDKAAVEDLRRMAEVKERHPERMRRLAEVHIEEVRPNADKNYRPHAGFAAGFFDGALALWDKIKDQFPRQ